MTKVEEAIDAAFAGVELQESRVRAFEYAVREVAGRFPGLSGALSEVRAAIYQNLLDAYRRVFMWGLLEPKARLRAKELAFSKFLKEDAAIMEYLDPEHKSPGGWMSEEEERFRREIEELKKV